MTKSEEMIQKRLFALQDPEYRKFAAKLLPSVPSERIIGVRVPQIRRLAKEIIRAGTAEPFLRNLPHSFLEENYLHSFLLDRLCKTWEEALERTEHFLPFIDNWAVCDSFRPRVLRENISGLYEKIQLWLQSDRPYTVRFAFVLMLNWFLDEEFKPEMLHTAGEVCPDHYYVFMAESWFYSMALIKQYTAVLPLFQKRSLPVRVHNKSLQKALESRQLSPVQKETLRKLKY